MNALEALLPETQNGFRSNRSTTDAIFAVKLLQEKAVEQHSGLHIAFIDLQKAFDTVNRDMLFQVLQRFGCPPKTLSIIRSLHDGMKVRVRTVDGVSEPFPVSMGVKQGCVLAPCLFNIYLTAVSLLVRAELQPDDAVSVRYRSDGNVFNLQRLKARTKTRVTAVFEEQYADDGAILSQTEDGLQNLSLIHI